MESKVTALIVAAGSGSRMGGQLPKQYQPIAGKAVLAHAVDALASHPAIDSVRVVIGEGQEQLAEQVLNGRDVGALIIGGAERADSVRAGWTRSTAMSSWSTTPPAPSARMTSSIACWPAWRAPAALFRCCR